MRRTLLLIMLFAFVSTAYAQENRGLALGLRAGTMGPGAELMLPIGKKLTVRGGGTLFSITRSRTEKDDDIEIRFDGDVTWGGFRALLDVHPFGNSFRLTGGAYMDQREVTATGVPVSDFDLDGKIFTSDKLGSMTAAVSFDQSVSPYAGIGFGNATRGSRVGFLLDIGVLYQGSPSFDMTGTGMIAPTANFGPTMEAGLETFKWMPLVSLGLSIRLR